MRALCAVLLASAAAARAPRLDVDLVGADLADVVRLFAEVGKINVVVADDVQGRVTMRLRDVAWDEAFRAVLSQKGCVAVREGGVVRVLRREALYEERRREIEARRRE